MISLCYVLAWLKMLASWKEKSSLKPLSPATCSRAMATEPLPCPGGSPLLHQQEMGGQPGLTESWKGL